MNYKNMAGIAGGDCFVTSLFAMTYSAELVKREKIG